ncbi:hypothetical protein [Streptomyces xantholiticus]|uniref:Secreted protein n=1 Tax=Streptomyces xantholiticus TaxID=68285 RepID=A0ABV1V0A6_9ACTN
MTTPPHQFPGPYGPAQQPGPYAHGHHQPQPPYHPYPAQQFQGPGPQGWGQAPVGPPPKKDRTWLVVGLTLGAVAVVGLLAFIGNLGSDSGGSSDAAFPAAEYRLTVPKELLGGEYTLIKDGSAEADADLQKDSNYSRDPDLRDPRASRGSYNGTATDARRGLVLIGLHGRFRDPAQVRDRLLDGMQKADGMSESRPPRTVRASGSDVDLRCAVLLSKETDGTSTVPVCAWGDGNTAAYVAFLTPADAAQDPESVDLDATAKKVLQVREETRTPIG